MSVVQRVMIAIVVLSLVACGDGLNQAIEQADSIVAAGVLDTSFGNGNGFVVHDSASGGNGTDGGYALALDSSGRIVVAGRSSNGSDDDMAVWRYTSSGELDISFGDGKGYVVYHNSAGGGGNDQALGVAIDNQHRIVVTGSSQNGSGNQDMAIWRLSESGELDTSFGGGAGYVVHDSAAGGASDDVGYAVIVDDSGRIVVAGMSTSAKDKDMALWRYTESGNLDKDFNGVGYTVHHNAAGGNQTDYATALTLDASNRILVSGVSNGINGTDMVLWRYTTTGVLDTSFGGGNGYVFHNSAAGGNLNDSAWGVAVDGAGNIVVGGNSYRDAIQFDDIAIWRYTEAGVLDTTFNGSGYVTYGEAAGGSGSNDNLRSIAIDGAGNIVAVGKSLNTAGDNAIVVYRFTPAGTLDNGFGGDYDSNGTADGIVLHDNAAGGAASDDTAWALHIDPHGRLLVTGTSNNTSGNADMVLWRFR